MFKSHKCISDVLSQFYPLSYTHVSLRYVLKLTKNASTLDFTLSVLSTWNNVPPGTHMIYCLTPWGFCLTVTLLQGLWHYKK